MNIHNDDYEAHCRANARIALAAAGSILLGLTGRRHQGKSTMTDILCSEFGFVRAHAFEGGKLATEAYFLHITGRTAIANRMVHGDLKDLPSEWLPGNASPRDFMERFGQFMGVQMGTEWTLEMEVKRLWRLGAKRIVVESMVYEADPFRDMGGTIARIERTGYVPPAVSSDKTQALIKEDIKLVSGSLEELGEKTDALMFELYGLTPRGKSAVDDFLMRKFTTKN